MLSRESRAPRGAALVGATALALWTAACGGGASTSRDQSTPPATDRPPAPRPRGSIIPGDPYLRQASAQGQIDSITPEELAPGVPASRVVIAGETPVAERSFLILLPPEVPIPFAVGDSIAFQLETLPGPPTWQPRNFIVTAENGELLAFNGVVAPPGWTVDVTGEVSRVDRGDYDEIDQSVTLTHAGGSVVTHDGLWRRLTAPDGDWHVAGSASDLEGTIPPDGGHTLSFMIVRAR